MQVGWADRRVTRGGESGRLKGLFGEKVGFRLGGHLLAIARLRIKYKKIAAIF